MTVETVQDADELTIVGVGASAGGLEAFTQMLEPLTPTDHLAIVFVQHLSPQHSSALPVLLATKTKLTVVPVTDHLKVERNHVYVIPPNVQITFAGGELRVAPRPHDQTQFTPIDVFFHSLAHALEDRAVGVILSGTASDGAAGLREIKMHGGTAIVQKPMTAKYDGMPRAAIATGVVDLVLEPREMAEQLLHLRDRPGFGSVGDAAADVVTDGQFAEMFAMLRRVSGVDFRQYKLPTLRRRLFRRIGLLRIPDVRTYVRKLRDDPQEIHSLYQDLLIHVTSFFREPESFVRLVDRAFPDLMAAHRPDDPIRIWVPGCATGEEVYSLAITIAETFGDLELEHRLQIFATDVSEASLDQARAGTYPVSIAADVSEPRLARFFVKTDGGYRISKLLRDSCVFARHDLTRDPPFSRLDLIVCRNVLIYLDAPAQRRLMSVFHYALKNQGFLMLGPAETTGPQSSFTLADKRGALYRKSVTTAARPIPFPSMQPPHNSPTHAAHEPLRRDQQVADPVSRLLLDRYCPPGVVIDANSEVLQFRGRTGLFLESPPGQPSVRLLKMVREGLIHPLRSALQEARRKHRTIRKEGIRVRRDGSWHEIALEVIPLTAAGPGQMLVLFDTTAGRRARASAARGRASGAADSAERVATLTRELDASREYLQATIQELEAANEELQSSNEEMLSVNEELQSTNEELDTAKEELQSVNEELNTVNDELHSRNTELTRVNSDLSNLLASVHITIVIVGEDLRIRRFTPMAEQVLNLIPGDLGRPIGQIKPNIVCDDLETLIRDTIKTVSRREREVQDLNGRWYSLRIRPYKSVENRLEGAVVTLIDVDAAKRYERQIENARDYFTAIVETVRQPLLVVDQDQRVRSANKNFYETFGVSPRETENALIYDLGNRQWDIPQLRTLLEQVTVERPIRDLAVEHDFPALGPRRMLLNARTLDLGDSERWVLISIEDVTSTPVGV